MAEYVAGRGTTALGILGTVLGGIGAVGGLGNCMMNANYGYPYPAAGYGYGYAPYEKSGACMHDVDNAEKLAQKDAEIARLNSERYADRVRDDAKQYGIEVYKELKKDIAEVKELNNAKWTEQMVVNANITNAITALNGQTKATADLVAQITRTAIPESAICSFNGRSCGCGNNI